MKTKKDVLLIVAHPDDETLWCGGTMLLNPNYNWFVACLCRKNDLDRAPKFKEALKALHAKGIMGNLDDSPEQKPLDKNTVKKEILKLLPKQHVDFVFTHSPNGEYTRHLRHEEIGMAVMELWSNLKIDAKELWLFAFEDGNKKYYPKSVKSANVHQKLPQNIWEEKYRIITEVYGFEKTGFEAKTTPETESFWKFETIKESEIWLEREGFIN